MRVSKINVNSNYLIMQTLLRFLMLKSVFVVICSFRIVMTLERHYSNTLLAFLYCRHRHSITCTYCKKHRPPSCPPCCFPSRPSLTWVSRLFTFFMYFLRSVFNIELLSRNAQVTSEAPPPPPPHPESLVSLLFVRQ